MLDISAAQKKYPLYRLAIISLELLDRKPYEMHPSWLSFAVKLTALGDNLSGTAGQKTLRDAPVVVKLRR